MISGPYKKRSKDSGRCLGGVSSGSQRRKVPPNETQQLRQLPGRSPWWLPGITDTCQRKKPVSCVHAGKPLSCFQGRKERGRAMLVSPGAVAAPGGWAASLAHVLREQLITSSWLRKEFYPGARFPQQCLPTVCSSAVSWTLGRAVVPGKGMPWVPGAPQPSISSSPLQRGPAASALPAAWLFQGLSPRAGMVQEPLARAQPPAPHPHCPADSLVPARALPDPWPQQQLL